MSHRRVNKRTGVLAGAGAAALVAAVIVLPSAQADPEDPPQPRFFAPRAAAELGSELSSGLGGNAAGWYYDGTDGRLVVNVLDERAADRVEDSGAVARTVENSTAELQRVTRTLSGTAAVPGTAWAIDPRTNTVRVTADSTVGSREMTQLEQASGGMPGLVTLARSAGEFRPLDRRDGPEDGVRDPGGDAGEPGGAADSQDTEEDVGVGADAAVGPDGGDAIFGGGARCSLGFNVSVQGAPAFLTAGHCGNAAATWTADAVGDQPLGTVVDSRFPGADFALVAYDDPAAAPPSTVDLQDGTAQPITRVVEAAVGMQVQRSGSTTGLSGGTVTGLDATVNYGNGDIVDGLIQTNVCAEPGDSGGPLFAGDAAVGLTSGGNGDCTEGGVTFFQPVTAALQATGAQLGVGGGSGAGGAG